MVHPVVLRRCSPALGTPGYNLSVNGGGGGTSCATVCAFLAALACVLVTAGLVAVLHSGFNLILVSSSRDDVFAESVSAWRGLNRYAAARAIYAVQRDEDSNEDLTPPAGHPIVCAHRGFSEVHSGQRSLLGAIRYLCIKQGICCADYDVFLCKDDVLMVGHPLDVRRHVFPASVRQHVPNNANGVLAHVAENVTSVQLKAWDPSGEWTEAFAAIARSVLELSQHPARHGDAQRMFVTLEAKAFSYLAEKHGVGVRPVSVRIADLLPRIASTISMMHEALRMPLGGSTWAAFNVIVDPGKLQEGEVPVDAQRRALLFPLRLVIPFKDTSVPKGDAVAAWKKCTELRHPPAWADVTMPSLQFLQICHTATAATRETVSGRIPSQESFVVASQPTIQKPSEEQLQGEVDRQGIERPAVVWLVDSLMDLRRVYAHPFNISAQRIVSNRPSSIAAELRRLARKPKH